MHFLTTCFFTPLAFFMFCPPPEWSTSWSKVLCTQQWDAQHARPSSCPGHSYSLCCKEDGPWDSQTCHRDLHSGPCPCNHRLSRFQAKVNQCRCRGADSTVTTPVCTCHHCVSHSVTVPVTVITPRTVF